jgi:hypothetical protein
MFTSKKISTGGNSQEFIRNMTYVMCSLPTETIFLSTEIQKSGVMIQLCTTHSKFGQTLTRARTHVLCSNVLMFHNRLFDHIFEFLKFLEFDHLLKYYLRRGVPNLEAKVVAGLKPPFCKIGPLLVGFMGQTRDQKTRALLHGPILHTRSMWQFRASETLQK